jgi:hypothetical protein
MASFTKGGAAKTPFGKNVYLRSTKGMQFESYTVAANSIPAQTIDGVAGQKLLQPGTVMAKITSGPDAGKVGPYQAAGTAEVQTITPSGTWSGGTFTLTFNGQTTAAIAYNAVAATIQTALSALSGVGVGNVTVTGGPLSAGAITITFGGNLSGDQPQVTANTGLVTGSTPSSTPATSTPGVAGAIDGRQTTTNIVGINDTFLPWQLMERDVEIGVLYNGTVVQGWCLEYNAAGAPIAMQNATATAMFAQKGMDVLFK